jgi:hypothetical protein
VFEREREGRERDRERKRVRNKVKKRGWKQIYNIEIASVK